MTNALKELFGSLANCRSGETSIQLAAFFGALAILIAMIGAPILDDASRSYAENRAFGIDRVITGSVEKSNRYTIRKSVLDEPTPAE